MFFSSKEIVKLKKKIKVSYSKMGKHKIEFVRDKRGNIDNTQLQKCPSDRIDTQQWATRLRKLHTPDPPNSN